MDKVADYITFIDNGKIVLASEKDSILESYGLVKGAKELLDSEEKKELIGISPASLECR